MNGWWLVIAALPVYAFIAGMIYIGVRESSVVQRFELKSDQRALAAVTAFILPLGILVFLFMLGTKVVPRRN